MIVALLILLILFLRFQPLDGRRHIWITLQDSSSIKKGKKNNTKEIGYQDKEEKFE